MTRAIVLDDDRAIRDSIARLLESGGVRCDLSESSADLLAHLERKPDTGCVVLDVRLRLECGVDILQQLRRDYPALAVIMISGEADIPVAVKSMHQGAFDFFEKPFRPQELLDQVLRALEWSDQRRDSLVQEKEFGEKRAQLTPREEEVLQLLLEGLSCKEIAFRFGLSTKTVHIHRSRVLSRMGSPSVVALVRNYHHSTEVDHGRQDA